MEKRIFLAVVISIAILATWGIVVPKLFPQFAKQPASAPRAVRGAQTDTTAATTTSAPSAPVAQPAVVHLTTATPVAATKPELTVVEEPHFIATFSNRGAELVSFKLKDYRAKDGSPLELVKARDASRSDYPFAIETRDPSLARRLDTALYAVAQRADKGATVLDYRYSDGAISVAKTFRITSEYPFDFSIGVTPPTPYRVVIGPGIRTLAPEERDSQFTVTGNGVVQIDDKLKVINREKGDRFNVFDNAQFVGIEDNYFLAALRPVKGGAAIIQRADFPDPAKKEVRKDVYAALNAASDGTVAGSAFLGPKQTKILEKHGYASTLQFGFFGFIGRLLLEVLIWINGITHNYGWAIIVLTVLIKIVLYPLQHKSIVSMKKMQRVQPKVESIKNKYKKAKSDAEQRQKMNVEMMKLYQQEGINPMGGCLPIALQLPILWGFYGILSRAIELRGAPFALWIHDLAAKDPLYITPILMTATMFIQQMVTPTTVDPAQRRMFMIMPLVFGWIFKEFPSGLVLYWLVQNILTIVQQLIMNKYWKDHPAELQKT